MITVNVFRKMALSFENTKEEPHFDKSSFRIQKKIFATLNEKENRATIKLTLALQDVFCLYDKTIIYPVPNKWGKQGWTNINLLLISKEMLQDALTEAYCCVAPEKLVELYKKLD